MLEITPLQCSPDWSEISPGIWQFNPNPDLTIAVDEEYPQLFSITDTAGDLYVLSPTAAPLMAVATQI